MTNNGANSNGRQHCTNLQADRDLGGEWERNFCVIATQYGRSFTRHQFRKSGAANVETKLNGKYHSFLLPDITLWSAPGEHHEIKHKDPVPNWETYGLETYRLEALIWFARETKQSVYYTIHDHRLAGGREVKINRLEDWRTVNILDLEHSWIKEKPGASYINSKKVEDVPTRYWPTRLWIPLEDMWDVKNALTDLWDDA